MTTMANLPKDLANEIFSRIPMNFLRSMRSTCKKWNALSKTQVIGKATAEGKHTLSLMVRNSKVYSLSITLQRIQNDDGGDFVVKLGMKKISLPDHVKIYDIFHCDGLFLCRLRETSSLLVWNPYLTQTRWIQAKNIFSGNSIYVLGYDNNRNHKILRVSDDFDYSSGLRHEIYRLNSNKWMVLDVTPYWDVWSNKRDAVSFKGNTYFLVQGNIFRDEEDEVEDEDEDEEGIETDAFLLCFDFTTETFGQRLPLPFELHVGETVSLSCVREDQLGLLYNGWKTSEVMEFWITIKVELNAMSWSKFLKVDTTLIPNLKAETDILSFFIEEDEKVAVLFNRKAHAFYRNDPHQNAHIIGEDDYLKTVDIGKTPYLLSSYVPSLVQLQPNQRAKRKGRYCTTKRKRGHKRIEIID